MFGTPAIAVSQGYSPEIDFCFAAEYINAFLDTLNIPLIPMRTLLNINFPPDPQKGINGTLLTRQSVLEYHEFYEILHNAGEERTYRLRGTLEDACEKDTDFYAVQNRYVSITALKYDRTDASCETVLKQMIQDV